MESDATHSVAWADYDADGDLDLAAGNGDNQPSRLYRNNGGNLTPGAVWSSAETGTTWSIAWGDVDRDGDLDLAVGNYSQPIRVYRNLRARQPGTTPTNDPPHVSILRPVSLPNADYYSTPTIIQPATMPVTFTYRLLDAEGDPVRFIRAFYSLSGGGQWRPATLTGDTATTNLAAAPWPTGTVHTLRWDAFADGLFGRQDDVTFRVAAYPATQPRPGKAAGHYMWGATAAAGFPFRVQGTQVRVLSGTTPISNAIVYRLQAGQTTGGAPLVDGAGLPLRTDVQGFLQGSSDLLAGDRLLALAPLDWSRTLAWAEGLSGTLHLHATNGQPTAVGLDGHTVAQSGVQTLVVSEGSPLLLLDLIVSLDWDARADSLYLDQLRYDVRRASQFLYDFTNGQLALGRVSIYQNADAWDTAHVLVKASNRLRPFAVQGGLVVTPTVDPQHADIAYDVGQVRMGATWNRYGNPGQNLGVDWPLALAHELSHFALFLDDTYLGLNDAGLLIPVDTCTGSAMGDMYDPSGVNTEFLNAGAWLTPPPKCAFTLANRTLARSEWETIRLWYPMLSASANPGPSGMPFDFTTVEVVAPLTPTATLADPTFFLDYQNGAVSSSEAVAYLIQNSSRVSDLGSPVSGQNRVLARGARPGDRLCVFDSARRHFGCEVIDADDDRLVLESDPTWAPLVQISPVTSVTLNVTVTGLPAGLPLRARLYPEYGTPTPQVNLAAGVGSYQATFNLAGPALIGYVALWVDESASETNPRRETIVAYAVSGNPGNWPASRGNGPASRGNGPASRGNGAPIVSPDGQMIFFTLNPALLAVGELYAVHRMAALPPLPAGKTALGAAYRLVVSPGVTRAVAGSISFQYLGIDALLEGVDEGQLTVHFWDGNRWRALDTVRSPYYNLASAASQGPGVYALLAGATLPRITSVVPSAGTNDITHTLIIRGSDFLEPLQVRLSAYTLDFSLPLASVSPVSITAVVTRGLSPAEYRVQVVNLGQPDGPLYSNEEAVFALFDPLQACFYDFFESGAGQWQRDGEWAIVLLADGQNAMTDSPLGPYLNATNGATRMTALTSNAFSLQGCDHPRLSYRHDYSLVELGSSVDRARVDISTDDGATWAELAGFTGGVDLGLGGPGNGTPSAEWNAPRWKHVGIGLDRFTGTVRLRFSLTVDRALSDKGWLLDDVVVASSRVSHVYLPAVTRH